MTHWHDCGKVTVWYKLPPEGSQPHTVMVKAYISSLLNQHWTYVAQVVP